MHTPSLRVLAGLASSVALLAACGQPGAETSTTSTTGTASPAAAGSGEREVASLSPRLVMSHEQGLTTIDTRTGKKHKTAAPHHGVAFELGDGSLITTQGTQESRSTVQVPKDGKVIAETRDCPGVHGEAAAKPTATGDTAVFGCTNGPVVYRDGAFHKVKVADAYSRSGNLAGGHDWPVVLGDYKVDKAAKQERPTRVALIDTRTATLSTVDVGSPYWFRSLARGPHGEGLVLTYDGSVKVIDPQTRKVTASIKAIEPWQEKEDWQQPGPAITVSGFKAYVTDADHRRLTVIDLSAGTVDKTFDLPHVPVEVAVVNGRPETTGSHRHRPVPTTARDRGRL